MKEATWREGEETIKVKKKKRTRTERKKGGVDEGTEERTWPREGKEKEYMEELLVQKERTGWKKRKGTSLTEEINKKRTSKE